MKLKILFLLALLLTITLTLFPSIAQESVSLEAFGWHLQTKQGAFVILILVVLFVGWFVQRLATALMAGPGKIWQTLRTGGQHRREQHLQTAFDSYVDMDTTKHKRAFKQARLLLPTWAQPLLDCLNLLPNQHGEVNLQHDPLHVAWTARLVSDPEWQEHIEGKQRKAHLEAWLKVHPEAALAHIRLLDIHLHEQNWQEALNILNQIKNQPLRSQAWIIEQKIIVLLALYHEAHDDSPAYLQQAEKLSPQHPAVILTRGEAHIKAKNPQAAEKIWLNHLKNHDHLQVAQATLNLMKEEGLTAFRRMEKIKGSHALTWLHACLAHAGKLDGLAEESLKPLLENQPCPLFWQTKAQWLAQKGEHEQAFEAYEQAIQLQNNKHSFNPYIERPTNG